MDLTDTDRAAIAAMPPQKREILYTKLRAAEAVMNAAHGQHNAEARRQSDGLGVTTSTVQKWVAAVKASGPTGLIDSRAGSR